INILIIINCFSTPVDLAFPDYRSNNDVYLGILNTIDFIFLFDIIITFFTAYENETLDIIDDHKAIANNYIKGWFIFDVVSIFPTDLVAQTWAVDTD
ncbi:MAG: ion transporter, partial [bacterium]